MASQNLDVWDYTHYVRYLRAIILKLVKRPHHCTRAVLDAVDDVLVNGPRDLNQLITTLPTKRSASTCARYVANAACDVVMLWTESTEFPTSSHNEGRFHKARKLVSDAEQAVLGKFLTLEQLTECGIDAFGMSLDDNRRDAAVAAFTAGQPSLARDIVLDEPRNPN